MRENGVRIPTKDNVVLEDCVVYYNHPIEGEHRAPLLEILKYILGMILLCSIPICAVTLFIYEIGIAGVIIVAGVLFLIFATLLGENLIS